MYISQYSSPLGEILLASDGAALTGLWFEGQKFYPQERKEARQLSVFTQTKRWLDIYFSGREPDHCPPLYLTGTPFQLRVWQLLQTIPYGKTVTYGQLAALLGKNMSAQAVGGAVGRNPISIIVPCHRVLGANGRLTGYAGGLERKSALLQLENP